MRFVTLLAVLTLGACGPSRTPSVQSPGSASVEGLPRPFSIEIRSIDADITAKRVGRMKEIQRALETSFSASLFRSIPVDGDFIPKRLCESQRASIVVVPSLRVTSFADVACSSYTSVYDTLTDTSGDEPEATSVTCKNTHDRIRAELSVRVFRSDRCSLVLGGITIVADSEPKKGVIQGAQEVLQAENSAVIGLLRKLSKGVLAKQLDKSFAE